MTITYTIDRDVLIIDQNGVTDPADIRQVLKQALADPRLAGGSHLLWDATEAPAQASADKMRSLIGGRWDRSSPLSNRIAMLVTTDLQYGLSRMFSAHADEAGYRVEVFCDKDDALQWLRSESDSADAGPAVRLNPASGGRSE